jgi:hypothetical protein
MIWQTFYCDGKYQTCERYRLSLAGKPVAPSLLPNGKSLDVKLCSEEEAADSCAVAPPVREPLKPAAVPEPPPLSIVPSHAPAAPRDDSQHSAFYVRFLCEDKPEAHARIGEILRSLHIRVDAMIKKKPPEAEDSPYRCFIFITDETSEVEVYRAMLRIEEIPGVLGKARCIPLEKIVFPALKPAA